MSTGSHREQISRTAPVLTPAELDLITLPWVNAEFEDDCPDSSIQTISVIVPKILLYD